MRKSKKSKGGKLKKKLALGSLIQDNPDDHINPGQYGPNNQPDYSIAKPKAPTIGQPKLTGKINPSTGAQPQAGAGTGISDAAKSFPVWGAAWGAIDSSTKSAQGRGTNKADNQATAVFNPATQALTAVNDRDYKGALAHLVAPGLGAQMTTARNRKKEVNRQRQGQSIEDTLLMNNADQPQLMKKGGKLVARRLNVESGGHANPISDDAVEMKANNPDATDSIETEDAFLDNNEIVDRKNRVFSDDLGFAKEAKKLEKQKSEGGRFSKSNERIEGQLDDLFKRQEESKKLSQGGYMSSKGPDFQDKLGFDTIDNPSTHKNQIITTMEKHSKQLGGTLTARDAIKGEGSSRKPKTEYLSEGGIHIKKSHKGLLHKNLGVKAGHKIPASKLAVHSGDSAALKKRKVFAQNAKKWHHDEGGMLAPEGSSLGPEALSANYPQKKTMAHLKARAVSTPKRGFSKGGDGAASWSDRVKYGLAKGGWKDALPEIGNSVATFAPNIASASLQSRLKGPVSPQLETATRFQRVDPSSQLAEIDRDASATNALVTRNTAQSSNLTSALGSVTAKKLAAKNQVMGQTQQINAGIQHGEGQIRAGQQARNTARVTDYRNNQVEFGNKKLQLTSENVGNLSAKLQAQSAEKKRMGLDERKFGVIMEAYNALPEPLKARHKNVFDYYNKEGEKAAKRLGGWIMKSKRNTKKK